MMPQLSQQDLKAIGDMIRRKRMLLGIDTLPRLHERLTKRGVVTTIPTLSRIETGLLAPSLEWVQELAAILRVPTHTLRPDIAKKFKRARRVA